MRFLRYMRITTCSDTKFERGRSEIATAVSRKPGEVDTSLKVKRRLDTGARRHGRQGEKARVPIRSSRGASRCWRWPLHLKLLSRFSLSLFFSLVGTRSRKNRIPIGSLDETRSRSRAHDRARASKPGKCQVVTFMRSTTCHGIGKCVVINGVPIRSHPE